MPMAEFVPKLCWQRSCIGIGHSGWQHSGSDLQSSVVYNSKWIMEQAFIHHQNFLDYHTEMLYSTFPFFSNLYPGCCMMVLKNRIQQTLGQCFNQYNWHCFNGGLSENGLKLCKDVSRYVVVMLPSNTCQCPKKCYFVVGE